VVSRRLRGFGAAGTLDAIRFREAYIVLSHWPRAPRGRRVLPGAAPPPRLRFAKSVARAHSAGRMREGATECGTPSGAPPAATGS